MPNTKSASRRVKRIRKQTLVNKHRKSRYKLASKKMGSLIEKGNLKEINKYFPIFQSELMKAAKTGVLEKLGGFECHWHVCRKKLLPVVRLFLWRVPWRRGKQGRLCF